MLYVILKEFDVMLFWMCIHQHTIKVTI
jgi:hypothetical protein